jgi:DNA-binding response OmpR family regulator
MSVHILIVDDSPILKNLLRAHLLAEGFEVSTADDYDGVASCLGEGKPDVIMLDTTIRDFSWDCAAALVILSSGRQWQASQQISACSQVCAA